MSATTQVKEHARRVEHQGERAARDAADSPLVETLTRLGYGARGLIYGIIGLLALQVVLGGSGAFVDLPGAIAVMGQTPLGTLGLYAVLVGLAGYGLWGLIRALLDPLHKGTRLKGLAERAGFAVSGISYLLLALETYGLITGGAGAARNGAQTAQTQQAVGTILTQPWGQWAVALAGAVIAGIGLNHIRQGLQRTFDRQFSPYALTPAERRWITRLGQFGTAARGVVFSMTGAFLLLAAFTQDASRAQGIDGVLRELLRQPFGPWLLGVVALGLMAFGLYSMLCGVWLRLKR